MGGSQSKSLGGTISRADLLKSTEQPRLLVNRLFTYFVDKLAQKDILALANPIRCSEYVFVMTDALDRLFYELRIEPGKDKKGVILFRKASELAKIDPESAEGQQRKVLCLSLAFFYIRIFQIYASLALSVQDDISYGSGIALQGVQGPRGPLAAPGLEAAVHYGGALSINESIGSYAPLKPFISHDNNSRDSRSQFYFDTYPDILYFNLKTGSGTLTLMNPSASSDEPNQITANITIKNSREPNVNILTIKSFQSNRRQYISNLNKHGPFIILIKKRNDYWFIKKTNTELDRYIYQIMSESIDVAMNRSEPTKIDETIEIFAPGGVNPIRGVGATDGRSFNVGYPEGLRTQALLAKLKQVPKPLAHCVARSLQLLNFDALSTSKLPAEVRTSICKIKFDPAHGGLPDIGAEVTRSPGIAALSQLFYDNISQGKPSMGEESAASYQIFVKELAGQFAENPSAPTVHLPSVINKMDKSCGSGVPSKRDKVLIVKDQSAIGRAQQAVQTLWKLQIEHDTKAIAILSKLVIVSKLGDGSIKIALNPLILQTGVPGVNIVAKEARELLVQYYKNCETAFRFGAGPLGAAGSAI